MMGRMLDLVLLNLLTAALALGLTLRLRVRPLWLAPVVWVALHVLVIQTGVLVTGLAGIMTVAAWR